ncbi:MAG: FtsQ-type POTRA domain-containing protein [Saccharofermentans sp.]|nr:FtsQ-type POTRA domain-containing protein [Saccharofermentans sp.]
MNDDELDKLFKQGADYAADKETPSDNEGDVVASEKKESEAESVTIIEEGETEETPDEASEEVETEELSEEEKEAIAAKKEAEKEAHKRQVRLERIRKLEAFENNAKLKMEEQKQKWKEKGSLKDRQYLEDFPLKLRTVLIILLSLVVLVLAWSIAFHPYFRVNTVTVTGNYELTDDEIMEGLNVQYGSHMFRNYFAAGNDLVKSNPYIEKINIKRKFPSSLEIEVTERKKIAYISTPDGYIAIDDEGTVLELCADKDAQVRPLICGININSATVGKKVEVLQDNSFRKMIIVLSAALSASEAYNGNYGKNGDYEFFENIKEIRIISSGTFFLTVVLPDGGDLQVKFNNMNTITDDMQWIVYAITENGLEGLPNGVLDMTGESYIYRTYGYEMIDNNSIAKTEE